MHSAHTKSPITHSVFPYFNVLSSHKVSQSPTVCFLISMHSVHTKSLNHPQCVSLLQCTQFTQWPPITHSVFPYFNALSSHKVSQSPTVSFLILMHSVHTMSLNYPKCISLFKCTQYTQGPPITQSVHQQCVFLFPCTQFTQGPPITHSVFSYFNALSSHKVSQSPTVCFLISMHSVHTKSLNHPQ